MLEMENKLACVALSLDTLLSPTAEEQDKSCVLLKKEKCHVLQGTFWKRVATKLATIK